MVGQELFISHSMYGKKHTKVSSKRLIKQVDEPTSSSKTYIGRLENDLAISSHSLNQREVLGYICSTWRTDINGSLRWASFNGVVLFVTMFLPLECLYITQFGGYRRIREYHSHQHAFIPIMIVVIVDNYSNSCAQDLVPVG
jgi:hypothetical protein